MPVWYYSKTDLKRTPSLADGIDVTIEQRYRREGARFIINVGTRMGLRYDTMATGVVYFHRFYMFHSFRTFPRYVTACCCLFLAGKVEETPKKCKDIIKSARVLLTDQQFTQFGDDPKEEVMTLERILLQTIKFDLQVDHPYGYLLKYAKCLKGEKTKLQKMVQMAWTFVNDSLCTTLCLQWEPEIIGIALMYLAGKLSKFEITDWTGRTLKHTRWWDMFVDDMSVELLEDICHQVLDLYSTPLAATPQDSPPSTPPPSKAHKAQTTPPSQILTTPPQAKMKETNPLPPEPQVLQLPPPVPTTATTPAIIPVIVQPVERNDIKPLLPPPPPPLLSVSPSKIIMKSLPPPPAPPVLPLPIISEVEQPPSRPIASLDSVPPPPPPPPYNFPTKPPPPVEESFAKTFSGLPPPPPSFQGGSNFQSSSFSSNKSRISTQPYPSPVPSTPPPMIHPSPNPQYGSYSQRQPFYRGNEPQNDYYPPSQGGGGYPGGQGSHHQMRQPFAREHSQAPYKEGYIPPTAHGQYPPSGPHGRSPHGQFPGPQSMRMPPMQRPSRPVPPPPPPPAHMGPGGYHPRYGHPMDMPPNSAHGMPGPHGRY